MRPVIISRKVDPEILHQIGQPVEPIADDRAGPVQGDVPGDELAEAQALYERAIEVESDFFEAHFNLGNIYHDLGQFNEAQSCYEEALRLNPFYADTHFYLAITLEKLDRSGEARAHWRAYQQLAPKGEWVELAKEFSE